MKTILTIAAAILLTATLTFAGPIEDPKLIYFMNDTPNVIELLEARITELEKQVKELMGLRESSVGMIWCDNFDCYDETGKSIDMWLKVMK